MEDGDMSTDIELNESPLLTTSDHNGNTTSQNLLRLILFFRSTELFIAGAKAAASRSPSLSRVSSSVTSYSVLTSTDAKDGLDLEIVIDDTGGPGPAVNSSASRNGNIGIELQRQRNSFNKIVREKNLESLICFGGVDGAADALNSDLRTGISDNSDDISQRKMVQVSQNWSLAHNYFHFLKKACKSCSIVLLFVAGVLSLVFGIKEEGLQSGWFDGAIVFLTLFVLLLFSSMRNWLEARTARKKSQKQILHEDVTVTIVRGGNEVPVSVSDLVYGDLACLEAGCLIPADGLFVSGEVLEIDDGTSSSVCSEQQPFLFYGSRVVKGRAKMLVTSKGMDDTVLGEMMRDALNSSTQKKTSVETSLDKLSECINIGGILISILIGVVLFLRFVLGKIDDDSGNRPDSKGAPTEQKRIMNALKIIVTESKGNARVLTTLLGVSLVGIMEGIPFVVAIAIACWNSKALSDRASAKDVLTCVKMAKVTTICTENVGWLKQHRIQIGEVFLNSNSDVCKAALRDGIGTSTAYSAMEQPLLSWAEENLGMQREATKKGIILENNGENAFEELCGVPVERTTDSGKELDVHFKGPAEHVLRMCSFYYDHDGKMEALNDRKKQEFTQKIEDMQGKHLEVIAYAQKLEGKGLTFLGMFGVRDPIASLVASGIKVILFSQHDVAELKMISRECGICETDAEVLTSEDLQKCTTDEEMFAKLEGIKVVGKCNSTVKQRIVRCLRSKGEVVAVLGERSADAPVMKEADIGLAIKTEYPEITTESADVIIVSGSFRLLIDMVICGRIINENLQKFIQVEVIMTIASSLINFISAVHSGDTPLSAIQLFWIYFLISFPGALALLSGQPNKNLHDTIRPTGPLITKAMCVNILLQSSYQTSIFVTIQFKGTAIHGISQGIKETMIFNGFALCQLFNIFSARELKELNIFKGIHQNSWFWVGSGAFVVIHVPFVAVYQFIAGDAGLNWKQWFGCCLIGAGTWLLDLVGKLLSDLIKIDNFQVSEIARHWTPELSSSRDWFIRMCRSTSMSFNSCAPSETMSNLQNPLMTGGSTANTFQNST